MVSKRDVTDGVFLKTQRRMRPWPMSECKGYGNGRGCQGNKRKRRQSKLEKALAYATGAFPLTTATQRPRRRVEQAHGGL